MAATEPAAFTRRSFIYRRLAVSGATFAAVAGAAVALDFGDRGAETDRARRLGLADLSPLLRTGFKGHAALGWLARQGVGGLATDNRADALAGGALAARLAPSEALIIGGLRAEDDLCVRLDAAHEAQSPPGCHLVMRREASFHFVLSGADGAAMMAKLCGVDLRERSFPAGAIAQTSVAGVSMIVIRTEIGATPAFHLMGDSASAGYSWDAIGDAMAEHDGTPVGLGALWDLMAAAG